MNPGPSFDELVGGEPTGGERERLRAAHELLVAAGPPPELPPGLAGGPQLDESPVLRRRRIKRRGMFLLAASLAIVAVFFAGYGVGHRKGAPAGTLLALKGTQAAPKARATLLVQQGQAGNWPMKLTVAGLPKLPQGSYYDVYLVAKGDRYLSCGSFVTGGTGLVSVPLNSPYHLHPGDRWIVTRETPQTSGHGPTVLTPA